MAFCDYSGYVWKNGVRVSGRDKEMNYHAILGNGPVYVCLLKQVWLAIYSKGDEIEVADILRVKYPDIIDKMGCIDIDSITSELFYNSLKIFEFAVDGVKIEYVVTSEDNFYQYAKIVDLNNDVWYGFSGYGVGEGFEDGSYGYKNLDRILTMKHIWREFNCE